MFKDMPILVDMEYTKGEIRLSNYLQYLCEEALMVHFFKQLDPPHID